MRWSYTIFRSDQDLESIQQALDGFGADGWEMVSVVHQVMEDENGDAYDQFTFFFKRAVG